MKNLFTLFLLLTATIAQAQFTANKLAVLKISAGTADIVDDGAATAGNAVLRPVTIMQFNTTGEAQTGTAIVTLSSKGTGTPRLTIDQRRLAHEGHLNLSGDRAYLTCVGYSTEEGLLAASGTINGRTQDKRVARIPASGVADISTVIPVVAPTVIYSNNSVRGAVSTDGTSFTIGGSGATATTGVQNATYGDPSTLTSVLAKDCRGIGLFGGTVYAYASGTGTIEGGGNSITLPPQPPATALNGDLTQFVFFDADPNINWGGTGFDLLYCADRNSGIRKFAYSPASGTWTAMGIAGFGATGTAPAGGVQTITGRIEGGKPTLYYTKAIVAPYTGSYLLKVVDNAGNGIWDGAGLVASPTYTYLANTDAKERFIGVAFTPGSSLVVIPVELMSFKGSLINDKTALQWETATEINAKEFVVEKSTNAKEFEPIGKVAAKGGNTRTNYNFDDSKLSEDINYYRLKMVDNDGAFKYSNTVAIKLGSKGSKGVSVFPNPVKDHITINHKAADEGAIIRIVNIAGSTVAQYNIAKEATQTSVDASQLAVGQYFINFVSKGTSVTTSFVK